MTPQVVLVHVHFGEKEGIRIFGTNHVIYKEDLDPYDWDYMMEVINQQNQPV